MNYPLFYHFVRYISYLRRTKPSREILVQTRIPDVGAQRRSGCKTRRTRFSLFGPLFCVFLKKFSLAVPYCCHSWAKISEFSVETARLCLDISVVGDTVHGRTAWFVWIAGPNETGGLQRRESSRCAIRKTSDWQRCRGSCADLAVGSFTPNLSDVLKVAFSHVGHRISMKYAVSIQTGTGFASDKIITLLNKDDQLTMDCR